MLEPTWKLLLNRDLRHIGGIGKITKQAEVEIILGMHLRIVVSKNMVGFET
jgi:hypothetical protein